MIWQGIALHHLGQHEEALGAYERAASITPENAKAWNNVGMALYDLKRYEEAVAASERCGLGYRCRCDCHHRGADLSHEPGGQHRATRRCQRLEPGLSLTAPECVEARVEWGGVRLGLSTTVCCRPPGSSSRCDIRPRSNAGTVGGSLYCRGNCGAGSTHPLCSLHDFAALPGCWQGLVVHPIEYPRRRGWY